MAAKLKARISYRTLCRRLQNGRLGIGVSTKRVDCCSVCNAWDTMVAPKIEKAYKDAEHIMLNSCPSVLENFDECNEYRAERPSYSRAFLAHIRRHCDEHVGCAAALNVDYVTQYFETGIVEEQEDYNFHWSLSQTVRLGYDGMLVNPGAGRIALCFDFQAAFYKFPPGVC